MYILHFCKKWLGYVLGDFFTNSSGHPDFQHGQACQTVIVIFIPKMPILVYFGRPWVFYVICILINVMEILVFW
jgi:hypothetical protein